MSDLGSADKDTTRSCIFDYPDRPDRPVPPTDSGGHPIPDYPYTPSDDWPHYPPPIPPEDRPPPGVPTGARKVGHSADVAWMLNGFIQNQLSLITIAFTAYKDGAVLTTGTYAYGTHGTYATYFPSTSSQVIIYSSNNLFRMAVNLDLLAAVAEYPTAVLFGLSLSMMTDLTPIEPTMFIPHQGYANATGESQHQLCTSAEAGGPFYGLTIDLYYHVPTDNVWSANVSWKTTYP